MDEIMNVAEGSEQNAAAGSETTEQSEAQADFSDTGADDGKESEHQTKEQNAENARRRREAEERQRQRHEADLARERRTAREEAILEVLNRKNPYTGEEMKDARDIEEYLAMKEIEEKGGDPVSDFAKHHKERERQRAATEEKRAEQQRWYADDRKSFEAKYPDVDVQQLIEDPDFVDYAEGKVGKRPLASIYEGYMERENRIETKARERAAQMLANKNASPGALSSPDTGTNYFSREQVQKMSPKEVKKNYDAIRESMAKWT